MLTRKLMLEVLKSNVVVVRFTKQDQTERTMTCTLDPQYLPGHDATTDDATRRSLVVWDLNKGDWRSFIVDEVNSFEVHG